MPHKAAVGTQKIKIEIVTTELADLAMQGFGSVRNCRSFAQALAETYPATSVRIINRAEDLAEMAAASPDLVVAGIKYLDFSADCGKKTSDAKIWLADYLEEHGLEFTGSGAEAIRLEFDKYRAEQAVRGNNLRAADSFIAVPGQYRQARQLPLPLPLFIKPLYESDSRGIDHLSIAKDFEGFAAKVRQIWTDFQEPALAETYLPGREFTVAILDAGNGAYPEVLPIELSAQERGDPVSYLKFSAKHENTELMQSVGDPEIRREVASLALGAYRTLGARDFGRIDIKMNADGIPCFLEANLLPGMHLEHSYFPIACQTCSQMTYADVVRQMTLPAVRRLLSR